MELVQFGRGASCLPCAGILAQCTLSGQFWALRFCLDSFSLAYSCELCSASLISRPEYIVET